MRGMKKMMLSSPWKRNLEYTWLHFFFQDTPATYIHTYIHTNINIQHIVGMHAIGVDWKRKQ